MKAQTASIQISEIWARMFQLLVFLTLIMSMQMLFGDLPPLQAWRRLYGGSDNDRGYDVKETADWGYVIVGYTSSFGAGLKDVYLIKTDIDGDTLWTKTYGGAGDDIGYSVIQTDDLGYLIAGHTNSFGGLHQVYLIKTDSDGNVVWTKLYGGAGDDMGYSVQKTTDLGYIIAGYTDSYGVGLSDVYLIKTDANGDSLWTKTYGGTGSDVGLSVQQTTDSGYIIAGSTSSFGAGGTDMYLIQTDGAGDTLWTKTYGIMHNEVAQSIQQTADMGYIVTGYMQKIGGGEDSDLYLLKVDGLGEEDWSYIETGEDYVYGYSVYQTSDEGYVVGGYSNSTGGEDGDLYLLRTNSSGDTLWKDKPDTLFTRRIYSVQQTSDGYYIACGYSDNPKGHGGDDVWLAKYKYEIVGVREEYFQKRLSVFHESSNPFTEQTAVRYELPQANHVDIVIYNHLGQAVRNLIRNMSQHVGTHTVVWDGTDDGGREVPTGVYFLTIETGEISATTKLVKLE